MHSLRFLWLCLLLAAWHLPLYAAAPAPDLKLDARYDGPLTLNVGQVYHIDIALRAGDMAGREGDWWIYAETPFGTFHYRPAAGWRPGLQPSYQGPLFDLSPFEIFAHSLPAGTYLLHFAVDSHADGRLDAVHYSDRLRLHIPGIDVTGSMRTPAILGRVVDLQGAPVTGAEISTSSGGTRSDSDGWFALDATTRAQWIRTTHPYFISRTRAARAGEPVLLRLTPNDGETVAFHFGGDAMAGRRFYDPNSDGDTSDGLIAPNAGVEQHLDLLRPVQALLEDADLSVVNFETPVTEAAYFDLTQPPPEGYHNTKDYVFATHPNMGHALKRAGIDLVDLGNNHLYDYLEQGVGDTLASLTAAELGFFGAGFREGQAWQPAFVLSRSQRVAFIGCTTIHGSDHPLSYVASDEEGKGGAARCSSGWIEESVLNARRSADNVIFMVHGGYEYGRTMSPGVSRYSGVAREAGADLVINHHPHVIGGFEWDGEVLTAETLGNFLFDQTVWTTLQSYLVAVHMRRGEVVRAYIEPLMIENYLPKGLTGAQAEFVAREATRVPGPFVVESHAMEVDVRGAALRRDTPIAITGGTGTIYTPSRGHWISAFEGEGRIRLGRDLLWVGNFEDADVDGEILESKLWRIDGSDKFIGPAYAYAGEGGLRLYRNQTNADDVTFTHLYRIILDAPGTGMELSLVGKVRARHGANVTLQLSWYPETRGHSSRKTLVPLELSPNEEWQNFRVDAVVPDDAVAVAVYLRLSPPVQGESPTDFDNLRLIAWDPAAVSEAPEEETEAVAFTPRYDHALISGNGTVTLSQAVLPGGEEWFGTPRLEVVGESPLMPSPVTEEGQGS